MVDVRWAFGFRNIPTIIIAMTRGGWQIAHECVHLLDPTPRGGSNFLEEGLATWYQNEPYFHNEQVKIYIGRNTKSLPDYIEAEQLVRKCIPEGLLPAVKEIREHGGAFRHFFDLIETLPNLRWVHLGFAGIDNPRFGAMLDRGVRLSNSPGAAAEPIAHTAMAGLLSLARRLPYYQGLQRDRLWGHLPVESHPEDISGQTLVVYGFGTIGGELARLARAFGVYVIGVRRSPRTDQDQADEVVHPDVLDTVLPRADWLAVTANLTSENARSHRCASVGAAPRGRARHQRCPRAHHRRIRTRRSAAIQSDRGRLPRRIRDRAAPVQVPAVGHAQRHHHAARSLDRQRQFRACALDLSQQSRNLAAQPRAVDGSPRTLTVHPSGPSQSGRRVDPRKKAQLTSS